MKFRKTIIFILGSLVTASAYLILNESFDLMSLAIGITLGFCSMLVCVIFFKTAFLERYDVRYLYLLVFFIKLLFIIIISGVKSILLGFSKNASSIMVTYESKLKSDMLVTLLANSITLTPGTTTVDKNGKALKIMKLYNTENEIALNDIEHLEQLIMKAQRSSS